MTAVFIASSEWVQHLRVGRLEIKLGAYEAALAHNHEMHDPKQPVEILRTIHSFDPCIACAVHVIDPDGEGLVQVKVC